MGNSATKYDPNVTPFMVFDLARTGMSDVDIAEHLDVTPQHFCKWKKKTEIINALKQARKGGDRKVDVSTFKDFVAGRLPKHLRELWQEIERAEDETNRIELVEVLLSRAGKRARQQLFLHAFLSSMYNVSTACRMVNITRNCFMKWVREDPDFGELIEEMQQIKKDFGESALLNLIRSGDSKATIFFNKTQNRDRGYGESLEITNKHDPAMSIDELELPLETRREILRAIRAKREQNTIEGTVNE